MKKARNKRWSVADLLDYDYFHYLDKSAAYRDIAERDRKIYLQAGGTRNMEWTPAELARIWLDGRRADVAGTGLPGGVFALALKGVTWGCLAIGLVMGLAYGFGVLKYTGHEAINLQLAFFWLVFLPLLLSLLTVVLEVSGRLLRRKAERAEDVPSPFRRYWQWLLRQVADHLIPAGERRRDIEAFFNDVSVRRRKYGAAPVWLLAARTQLFAFMFACGSLVAVWLSGIFHDLAFAWQTTTSISPEQVYRVVTMIAAPWRSWASGCVPSLINVAGSRVVLKEGIAALDNSDLGSWWAFLCMAMLFYAVLPRLLLLLRAILKSRQPLKMPDFNDAVGQALFRRMTSPPSDSDIGGQVAGISAGGEICEDGEDTAPDARFQVFVAEDIRKLNPDKLKKCVLERLHGDCGEIVTVDLDEDEDRQKWRVPAGAAVLLVLEGWQPCTLDYLDYIRALRNELPEVLIVLGLTGKPVDGGYEKLSRELFDDWKHKISSMRDALVDTIVLEI